MGFLLEGMDEKLGRISNVTFCVQLFGLIQDNVSTSEYLVENEVLYACTSLSHKCQKEFSQLARTGYGKVLVPLGSTVLLTPLNFRSLSWMTFLVGALGKRNQPSPGDAFGVLNLLLPRQKFSCYLVSRPGQ